MRSVRSARGLQGRQELELLTPGARRMLVCVIDFVLRQALLGNFCAKRANEARRWNEECSLSAGAAWCWSVAFDTRREELVTPRGPALQEIVQGHCHLQCVSAGKAFDTRREERECVRGFRHTAGKMRRGIKS